MTQEFNFREFAEKCRSLPDPVRYRMDVVILKLMHRATEDNIYELRKRRNIRIRFLKALTELAEDGKIAVIESGRDCDCVEYFGQVHIIDATKQAYDKLYDDTAEWADGPFHFQLERPSVAEGVTPISRDLVMEAHENGHPHSIVSQFA